MDENAEVEGLRGLLAMIEKDPTLLELSDATQANSGRHAGLIESRLADEIHYCLRHGKESVVSMLARHDQETVWRWLDLCPTCMQAFRVISTGWDHASSTRPNWGMDTPM